MEMIPISAERKAQFEEFAHRNGQGTAEALDSLLADYLAGEQSEYQGAVEGIREGYDDLKAGRTQLAEQVFEELRGKHGLPR
jgi:hypothetical protein